MSSKITDKYGVPLPIDALFFQIAIRHGVKERNELKQIYQEAMQRYERATKLDKLDSIIQHVKSQIEMDILPSIYLDTPEYKQYQYCLDHPQEFINGDFTLRSLAAGNPLVYTKIRE